MFILANMKDDVYNVTYVRKLIHTCRVGLKARRC